MKYTTSKTIPFEGRKATLKVTIRLSDPCKNGHDDFAITGEVWFPRRRDCEMCGCIHDIILEHFPEFKPFVDLHLCDNQGVPMYPIANGMYHSGETRKNYLRLTDEELTATEGIIDDQEFYNLLPVGRWKEEASEAIKFLEQLTGEAYVPTQGSHFDHFQRKHVHKA